MSNEGDTNDPIQRARDEERRRIASELHDRVLQTLANVAQRLEATRKQLLQKREPIQNELAISEEGVRSSIREIRCVLASGRGRAWQAGTLLEKLEHELRSIERDTGIETSLELDPPEASIRDADLEYEVFQATTEALRNMVRHADAVKATLGIALSRNLLTVSLSDDGKGFDPTAGNRVDDPVSSHGLRSMRSRVERLGGAMAIRSAAAEGTTVSFSIPTKPLLAKDPAAVDPGHDGRPNGGE